MNADRSNNRFLFLRAIRAWIRDIPILLAVAFPAPVALLVLNSPGAAANPRAHSQDVPDEAEAIAVHEHGTFGQVTRIDYDAIRSNHKRLERSFKTAMTEGLRVAAPSATPRGSLLRFDSGLVRASPSSQPRPRRLALKEPLPAASTGFQLVVGELADLVHARENGLLGDTTKQTTIYLLAKLSSSHEELSRARAALGHRIGLVSAALIKEMELDAYPVRIVFEDPRHVRIEPILR